MDLKQTNQIYIFLKVSFTFEIHCEYRINNRLYLDWSIPFRMLPSEIWKTKNSQTDADLKIRLKC